MTITYNNSQHSTARRQSPHETKFSTLALCYGLNVRLIKSNQQYSISTSTWANQATMRYQKYHPAMIYTIIFSVLKFSLPRWGAGRCNENFRLTGSSTRPWRSRAIYPKLSQRLCWLVTVLWLTFPTKKRWVKWTLSSRAPSAWIDTLTPGRCRALTATARTASVVFPWNWIMEDR